VRILLVACWDLSRDDAPAVHVDAVASGLRARGHEVSVLAPAPEKPLEERPYVVELVETPRGRLGPQVFAVRAATRIARARAHVVYVRDFEASFVPLAAARARGLATLLEANGILEEEARDLGFDGALHGALVRTTSRAALRLADRVLAVSEGVRRHAVLVAGVEERRVSVIENGVHPELQRPHERARVRAELGLGLEPVLGFLGGFQAWQGVERLIQVFPRVLEEVRDARLVVAGFGPMDASFRAAAERSPARARISFPGRIPRARAPLWNAAFDVGVHLARPGRSCSSVKLAAYAAAGIPVLATRLPDFAFVEREAIGQLVDFDDDDAIARAASELLLSPEERSAAGERARAYVLRERTWARVAERTERLLEEAQRRGRE
jgi:glycosyltransferase involved in cell wall biosynthesis